MFPRGVEYLTPTRLPHRYDSQELIGVAFSFVGVTSDKSQTGPLSSSHSCGKPVERRTFHCEHMRESDRIEDNMSAQNTSHSWFKKRVKGM